MMIQQKEKKDYTHKSALNDAFPNPFNPSIQIFYSIANNDKETPVSIKIYNISGRHIKTLIPSVVVPGYHSVIWEGTDIINRKVPSGIYFVIMTCGEFRTVQPIAMMK